MTRYHNKISIKIPHKVVIRSPGLLPMLYKVGELADELEMPERTLRDWLSYGAPHQRDGNNHIWIDGEKFAGWVGEQKKKRPHRTLQDNEATCFRCKTHVEMLDPQIRHIKGKLYHISGTCEKCGQVIVRGGCYGQQN